MDIRINLERLRKDIEELGQIGRDPKGGISRPSFSSADLEARQWLKDRISSAGLQIRQDGAGNIFGRLEGSGSTIMAGSHIDTVINGGKFDGSIGVLSGLECLRRIKEVGVERTKPLEVASFTDEEGNLVGDYLGSRSFLAAPSRELLEKGKTQFGIPFTDILEKTEFSVDSIMEAHKQRQAIDTFLEIHIEQGPVLETENKQIGIVEVIAGKRYWVCRFLGEASHAGTTPFELRHDALLGLADFALKSTQYVATHHYGSMLTIGRVQVHPGAFTVVPGEVDFSLDFRSTSQQTLENLEEILVSMANDVATTRGLQFSSRVVDQVDPVIIPDSIKNLMKTECDNLGYDSMMLPSGAGHDAQIIASVADVGMIFIPCEDGLSHSPKENIKWEDLDRGANLLLQMLIHLSR
jgi:N-carbamoyl-L-amino-acid hydrolase